MYIKPKDIKLERLSALPVGSIATLPGYNHFPLIIKLANGADGVLRCLTLGGEYTFHVSEWEDDSDPLTFLVCPADETRFKLDTLDTRQNYGPVGTLTIRDGDAFINSLSGERRSVTKYVSPVSWDFVNRQLDDSFIVYSGWSIGRIDAKGEFSSIFQRE